MFTFAWPLVFLLLPLPWVYQKFTPQKEKKNEVMLRVPFLFRIQALSHHTATSKFVFSQRLRQLFSAMIWIFLILACANPQWLGNPQSITQSGRNIMLAIDLSQSMEIPDLQRDNRTLNRLQTVKEVAANFIDKRSGDKLGLILFGSKAYLQTPLTLDRKTVRNMLDDATIGLAGGYTAIGDAIALAVKKLSNEDIKSRVLILFTDGGNNTGNVSPLEAAELAKENKIRIYSVGIGAQEMVVQGILGPQVINPSADLDEDTLKKIATLTQGQYFRAQDEKTLINILESINQLEPIETPSNMLRPITALFYWPLAVAMLLSFILISPYFSMKGRL